MKKLFTIKALSTIALVLVFAACKNPGEDIKVVVNMDLIKYSALLHISDETGVAPQNVSIIIGGAAANDIYEISGKKVFPVKDGIITLGLSPRVVPAANTEVSFTVNITAPGYLSLVQAVSFKKDEMQQVVPVILQKIPVVAPVTASPTTTAPATPAATAPATPAASTPASPAVATPATPAASTPAATPPAIPATAPAAPAPSKPAPTTPAASTPAVSAPATPAIPVTPAVTVPAAPVATAPVVAPSPVNVSLDFTGYCTNRPNLQVRPSLYVFYRLKDSGTAFAFLGFMKDGHLDTKLLFNKVYEFQITYAGVAYTIPGRIEQTTIQSTFDMGAVICSSF